MVQRAIAAVHQGRNKHTATAECTMITAASSISLPKVYTKVAVTAKNELPYHACVFTS